MECRATLQLLLVFVLTIGSVFPLPSEAHSGPHGGVDTSPEPSGASPFTVIADSLANPRGIFIQDATEEDDEGGVTIYVAEAGSGGSGPCLDSANGDYHDCYGATGAITRVTSGIAKRIIIGLPSLAGPTGGFAIGPSRIVANGKWLFATIANYGGPAERAVTASADSRFGKILRFNRFNHDRVGPKIIADISAFEDANNPDGDEHKESNPNGLAFGFGRNFLYATDAAANDLLMVRRNHRVSLRYVFPVRYFPAPPFLGLPPGTMLPVQSVPTGVVEGPDGAHYVAEFTGFPFPKGAARVFRFDHHAEPTVYAEGFTNIIDIAFGPDGSLYVLEMATNGLLSQDVTGSVVKVSRDGTRTVIATSGLAYPTAIAVDHKGNVYVANFGTSSKNAQLVRL